MVITKEQARRVAKILYPNIWPVNPVEAIARTIEFLHDSADESDEQAAADGAKAPRISSVVRDLAEHMRRHKLHVNVVARAVGVSTYTVRTWVEGKYTPSEENAVKIGNFLRQLQGTPEILTPET